VSSQDGFGPLADVFVDATSLLPANGWEGLTDDVRDSGAVLAKSDNTDMLSDTPEETRCSDRDVSIVSQRNSGDTCHVETTFTAVSSLLTVSRWKNRLSQYKEDHVQQKKGRRERNRVAIGLLTIPLPLELRRSGIRPLNEAIRKLSWREKRDTITEDQRAQLGIYREIQGEWQKLLRA
jgi:hypothetical protein